VIRRLSEEVGNRRVDFDSKFLGRVTALHNWDTSAQEYSPTRSPLVDSKSPDHQSCEI
jgi:hypothetical protein